MKEGERGEECATYHNPTDRCLAEDEGYRYIHDGVGLEVHRISHKLLRVTRGGLNDDTK